MDVWTVISKLLSPLNKFDQPGGVVSDCTCFFLPLTLFSSSFFKQCFCTSRSQYWIMDFNSFITDESG